MLFKRRHPKRQHIAEGNAARDEGRWDAAVEHYTSALLIDPGNARIRVQLGHVLKELGRLDEAEATYRHAAALRPDDPDVYVQIGHVLKLQGRQDAALDAYAEALRRGPDFESARAELIAAGARNRLPESLYGRSAVTDALVDLSSALRQQTSAINRLASVSVFPIEAYDAFRQTYPVQPPPPSTSPMRAVLVVIDAEEKEPADVRLTLASLIDQHHSLWRALVRCTGTLAAHPVGSMAAQDPRIRFVAPGERGWGDSIGADEPLIFCDAGLAFDPLALSWLLAAQVRTEALVVYADHDHHDRHWRRGRTFTDPVLYGLPDPWDLETAPEVPAVVLVRPRNEAGFLTAVEEGQGDSLRRQLICEALSAEARIVHVPLILSSLWRTLETEPEHRPFEPKAVGSSDGGDQMIEVVIPTRDEVEALRDCVESLLARAAAPEAVRLLIVDNRSIQAATIHFLTELAGSARVRVQRFDEPFNWARLNNQAARASSADLLVFANNDLEMLTPGWDERLRAILADKRTGAIGARLLYPDRTVQHAGIVLGVNDLRPVHDGLRAHARQGGPQLKWLRTRQAAAVTGAFMALRREVFIDSGGFDEGLAVSYNDVDLCLRLRENGLAVLYDPAIEIIHHESKTRGRNHDHAKVAWDDAELAHLYANWKLWMAFDPGKNPSWHSTELRPYDGMQCLTVSQVLRHIDLAARSQPWSIDRELEPLTEFAL